MTPFIWISKCNPQATFHWFHCFRQTKRQVVKLHVKIGTTKLQKSIFLWLPKEVTRTPNFLVSKSFTTKGPNPPTGSKSPSPAEYSVYIIYFSILPTLFAIYYIMNSTFYYFLSDDIQARVSMRKDQFSVMFGSQFISKNSYALKDTLIYWS